MKNIYRTVHHYKTKEERLAVLSIYKRKLMFLLDQEYDPFVNNSDWYLQKNKKKEEVIVKEPQIEDSVTKLESEDKQMTVSRQQKVD